MEIYDYQYLLVYAVTRINNEYKSVLAFTKSELAKKLSVESTLIRTYLSVPRKGDKKNKSFSFMQELYKVVFDIELTQTKSTQIVTKITSEAEF